MRPTAVRIAICDDSALFRRGLALLLADVGIQVIAEAAAPSELLSRIRPDPPDAVVLDIRMPPTFTDEGLAAAARLSAEHPGIGILVLSTYAETAYATRLLDVRSHGVGYLLKDRVDDAYALRDTLDRIVEGDVVIDPEIVLRLLAAQRKQDPFDRLSPREREVLELMAEGRTNAAIGRRMHLSPRTVESHVAAVFDGLGLPAAADDNRRVLAVLAWLRTNRAPG
jgi:DNA-binding NarL/FixJ family response regulator